MCYPIVCVKAVGSGEGVEALASPVFKLSMHHPK